MEEQKLGLHKINIVDRSAIVITGVKKVISSNQNTVVLKLKDSDLVLTGSNLSMENFIDNTINMTGTIDSIKYTKQSHIKESFFKRVFK